MTTNKDKDKPNPLFHIMITYITPSGSTGSYCTHIRRPTEAEAIEEAKDEIYRDKSRRPARGRDGMSVTVYGIDYE